MRAAVFLGECRFTHTNVWESAREIGEVGAEMNSTPDLSRIVDNWGVLGIMTGKANALNSVTIPESHSDAELTSVDVAYIDKRLGLPFYVVHRLTLQNSPVAGALALGSGVT